MKKILIGLGSKAQVGKDYAAFRLKEYFDVERIAFADKLKEDLAEIFSRRGLDFNKLCQDPETKKQLRPLMVEYGQTMRFFNPNIWVDLALKDKELTHQVTIITDVRFPNEVLRLKELGGCYVDIQTDTPYANATEAEFSPTMKKLADFEVRNKFDEHYVHDMVKLVKHLLK